jgi:hypothetical protein
MSNRDLLKEAIADAKAVKEMAISNAKAALEEAFTPRLKSMLANKLQEMEDEDEKDMHTEEMHDDEYMSEEELNELLAELEAEDDDHSEKPMKEAEGEEESEEEEEEEAEQEFDLDEMSEEDLKAFIEEVVDEMIAAGELEAGEEEESEEGSEDELEITDEESEEEPVMEGKDEVNEVISTAAMIVGGLATLAGGAIAKAYKSFKDDQKAEAEKMTAELIAKGEKPEEAVKQAVEKIGGATVTASESKEKSHSNQDLSDEKESRVHEKEMNEALKTVKFLKAELQEVNLLNAKLLYTNRIFKSKNLTETQKVKVLSSFDKAESVKEVKLVYETLVEGLRAETSTGKHAIKESKSFASKAVGVSTKKPVVETDDMVNRFQRLAGIK